MSTTTASEPPAGIQGSGTADQPYDQGNKFEQTPAEASGIEDTGAEPISDVQGKGTSDDPYDNGNVSANQNTHSSRLIDDILGRKNKGKSKEAEEGTIVDTATAQPVPNGQASAPVPESKVHETAEIATERHNEQASQQNATAPTTVAKADPPIIVEPTPTAPEPTTAETSQPIEDKGKEPERGRGKEFQSFTAPRTTERSVSPGTLPDGRHAQTDGDRGMGYSPATKLGKLGAKFGIKSSH